MSLLKKVYWVVALSPISICLAQSVEVFPGDDNVQVDIQWLKPFTEGSRFLFFNRNRVTVDYNNNASYFISGITAYELEKGLGIANEINISGSGLFPKLGPQFLKASKQRTIYAFVNIGYLDEWIYGVFCFARLEPKLSTKLNLYVQLEVVNSSSSTGNIFFAQRPRIGLSTGKFQFGFAGDFVQIETDFQYSSNLGVFLRNVF